MSCEGEKKVCCEKFEMAKTDMVTAGFDPSYIADLIAQYGDDVVNLVVEALRNGFSKNFIIDTLMKFGPMVLQFLLSWFTKKQEASKSMGMAADAVVDAKVLDASLIETFLERLLPKLLDKYGEQLIDAFIGMLVRYLSK